MVTETSASRWRWLALAWGLVVLAVIFQQYHFWKDARLDTDVLALLPTDEQAPALNRATRLLTQQSAQRVVMLVGATDARQAGLAVAAAKAAMPAQSGLTPVNLAAQFNTAVDFYTPWRDRLLTSDQRAWLQHAQSDDIKAKAILRLYQPLGGAMLDWRGDPLGLWPAWWSARAGMARAHLQDDVITLEADGLHWIALGWDRQGPAFSMTGDSPVSDALAKARAAAKKLGPDVRVITAGVPLHAEAAAAQASMEMTLIGAGSLAAVLILVWLCFRSLRPILLVGLSLIIGCAFALSVTSLLFGRVHLLTLVFGASLVGVAEDYGFHYFAARQGKPIDERWKILRRLIPGLALALATSAIAYLALGLAPFPGLRQMAVFSCVGLAAAFMTVACWFPMLDRHELPVTPFAKIFSASLHKWPRWKSNQHGWLLAVMLAVFIGGGLARLESRDDLRQLQSTPALLAAEQMEAGRLLGLPSPAQFFLIEGDSPEKLLQQEEALKARLDPLVQSEKLKAYRAVSDWLPSKAQQASDAELTRRADTLALQAIAAQTGESVERTRFNDAPLEAAHWLQTTSVAPIASQWLGEIDGRHYSVLLLAGLAREALPAVMAAGGDLPGVRWIDRTADYSRLLERYRISMGKLLLLGFAAVFGVLLWRFKKDAWRVGMPTALGSLLVLAIFGWSGVPLQLFSVLAMMLLLGMGVDFGIFLQEHPGDTSAWLAVALAGISTLLSFGLLSLSATPALHAFGLTMLLGESLIWILTPCFRTVPERSQQNARQKVLAHAPNRV